MCGIAGIVGPTAFLSEGMQRMLYALRHRGPDGEGIEQDSHAIFGHRRLSIIDLAGGRQPLVNADRSIWLVCNGEIYNYRELRADLEARGRRFLTHSDCEVIIALYELHGERLLEHIRGMFAFALWDARRRRLLVARDHLGQKPLYYAHTGRGFAFASEIKALLAFDPTLRELDLAALDQYLALRLIAPPLSMFKGIRKLPPAHLLILEADAQPVIRRYWKLDYQPKLVGSEDDLLDELESKIEESLRLHLVSDVPVGAFLSGGLDSSLLVAMLAKRVGVKNLPTFTVSIDFDSDTPVVRPSSYETVGRIADAMVQANLLPYSFLVVGHTSSDGRREANAMLSQRRADAIRDSLVNTFKISSKRIQSLGLGEEQFVDQAHPTSPANLQIQIVTIGKVPEQSEQPAAKTAPGAAKKKPKKR